MAKRIKQVLVVDDDRTQTVFLESQLKKNGFQVNALNDAAEGLEFAMAKGSDLIILDVMMPIINGFNFCRLLKAQENRKDIPIILLTARDQLKDIEIGLEMGAEAYLIKPLNIDELLKTIKILESKKVPG